MHVCVLCECTALRGWERVYYLSPGFGVTGTLGAAIWMLRIKLHFLNLNLEPQDGVHCYDVPNQNSGSRM